MVLSRPTFDRFFFAIVLKNIVIESSFGHPKNVGTLGEENLEIPTRGVEGQPSIYACQ